MQINDHKLIAECSSYDFKEEVERKKTKSWLKTVSAFANGNGGSLYYGIDDEGTVTGLTDAQSDAEFISEAIKARIDPVPDFQLLPYDTDDGKIVLEVKIEVGNMTPYYYYFDGARTAFVRIGNESVTASSQQLLSLVLKGRNSTYDSLATDIRREEHSFIMLANTFKEQTHQQFDEKLLQSFGLVTPSGYLTNAGLLFADNCPVYQSRLFCTRWDGLEKDYAIGDAEYSGNLMMLLRNGVDFIKSFTNKGWKKLPNRRLNTPDYAERATFEGLVNHLIHRDYVVVGSEVHIDIYDDRLVLTSPGGMYDGTLIQERDINTVASCRRNPVIADVFAQMDFMEKRGSGLRKICRESAILPNYKEERKPTFRSEGTVFYTVFKNVNYKEGSAPESILKTTPITTPITTPMTTPISGMKSGTKIIELMAGNPKITATDISVALTLSRDHVKKLIRNLRENGIIQREGTNKGGYWKVLPPYNNPKKTNK